MLQIVAYIGDRLRELRDERFLSQRELAKAADLSPTTIFKLEANQAEPPHYPQASPSSRHRSLQTRTPRVAHCRCMVTSPANPGRTSSDARWLPVRHYRLQQGSKY
jgi:hypothetical protein